MLAPSDIRIGNWLRNFLGEDFQANSSTIHYFYNEFAPPKPIELTEEWLIKFGFIKYNNAWMLKKPKRNSIDFEFSIWETLKYNTAELMPKTDYVHQLQNLYYALTSEELTIKDTK